MRTKLELVKLRGFQLRPSRGKKRSIDEDCMVIGTAMDKNDIGGGGVLHRR